jgi:hypothetical protein
LLGDGYGDFDTDRGIGHLAWHSEAGMLMQFLVASDKVGTWTVPEEVKQMCEKKELQRGGPIPDEDFY